MGYNVHIINGLWSLGTLQVETMWLQMLYHAMIWLSFIHRCPMQYASLQLSCL